MTGVFIGSLCVLYLLAVPFAIWFYFYVTVFPLVTSLAAALNFLLLVGIWHVSVFLTTLKEYRIISFSFLVGMAVSVCISIWLGYKGFRTAGILNGFSMGLTLILSILYGLINFEYPPMLKKPFGFIRSYAKYWEYAVAGILCGLGIWVDKWIMWVSPDSVVYPSRLVCDLNYSNAMFLAYLTVIPSLAYFLYSIETIFDREILKFYASINEKATLSQITAAKADVIQCLFKCMAGYFFVQGFFTVASLLMAPEILYWLNVPMNQLGILRYGVLGAFYQCFFVFFINILFYIDQRKAVLYIYLVFFALNSILTYVSVHFGFQFYGTGYFTATLITFIISVLLVISKISRLDYHIFIR